VVIEEQDDEDEVEGRFSRRNSPLRMRVTRVYDGSGHLVKVTETSHVRRRPGHFAKFLAWCFVALALCRPLDLSIGGLKYTVWAVWLVLVVGVIVSVTRQRQLRRVRLLLL
jgi:hypothetical protein